MGRAVVRSSEKQMSCFRAFDSNLPVLDVQIMGGEASWRGAGDGQKKGDRGSRDRGGGGAGRAIALPLLLLGFIF